MSRIDYDDLYAAAHASGEDTVDTIEEDIALEDVDALLSDFTIAQMIEEGLPMKGTLTMKQVADVLVPMSRFAFQLGWVSRGLRDMRKEVREP